MELEKRELIYRSGRPSPIQNNPCVASYDVFI